MSEDDYGFSEVNESEFAPVNDYQKALGRIDDVKNLVLPFLKKMGHLNGDMIRWPEEKRKQQCQEMIDKINNI